MHRSSYHVRKKFLYAVEYQVLLVKAVGVVLEDNFGITAMILGMDPTGHYFEMSCI